MAEMKGEACAGGGLCYTGRGNDDDYETTPPDPSPSAHDPEAGCRQKGP